MVKYVLKLYIKGSSEISENAKKKLTGIVNSQPYEDIDLTIIDLDKNHDIPKTDRIIVVPTLVVTSPQPARMIIADLADKEKISKYIGLTK